MAKNKSEYILETKSGSLYKIALQADGLWYIYANKGECTNPLILVVPELLEDKSIRPVITKREGNNYEFNPMDVFMKFQAYFSIKEAIISHLAYGIAQNSEHYFLFKKGDSPTHFIELDPGKSFCSEVTKFLNASRVFRTSEVRKVYASLL
jgi:hypothetical protein